MYFAPALMRAVFCCWTNLPVPWTFAIMLLMPHVRDATHALALVTLVVLHDLTLAASFADRIIVKHAGRSADARAATLDLWRRGRCSPRRREQDLGCASAMCLNERKIMKEETMKAAPTTAKAMSDHWNGRGHRFNAAASHLRHRGDCDTGAGFRLA
ncbi:hypothetical protein AS026_33825 [Rhizobium altiplani]|uniref:Uncharacterized protein n=1 Tax=Rhizobium altiplani TaxID=1864509 RepID=A0A109JWS5_9HYPH|nr:hypothetical protein AS026_33825 [Rhizobium altiplani]